MLNVNHTNHQLHIDHNEPDNKPCLSPNICINIVFDFLLHEAPPKREFKAYYGISTFDDDYFQQIVWGSALYGTAVNITDFQKHINLPSGRGGPALV